jgi:hypothetical protein
MASFGTRRTRFRKRGDQEELSSEDESQEQQQRRPFYEDEKEYQQDIQNAVDKLDKEIGWPKALESHNPDDPDDSDGSNKGPKEKKKDNSGDIEKRKLVVYKYSNRQRIPLHEAVIIEGSPCFLYFDNEGKLKAVNEIEENTRILRPPNPEEYPYLPYEFDNLGEVISLLNEVKEHTEISYYYEKCKAILQKYNSQDDYKLHLAAADITWTYSQDKFATSHYLNIIGDNGSGKSSLGLCFEVLGYRPVNMTNPSAANLFRVLGTIEAGQCTIIAEEADKIDKNPEILSILKTGYHIMGKVAKVNLNIQKQEFFWTYCYKVIISERSLSRENAKGVLDRTFVMNTFNGKPIHDIKETLNPAGNEARKALFNEIMKFRKLMLLHRLVHYQDSILDLDIGLEGRDKELCKPLQQLFNESNTVKTEIENALDAFLNKKRQGKKNSVEVAFLPILARLISTYGIEFRTSLVWNEITQTLEGTYDNLKQPNEFHTADFGTIYRNSITNLICDKFGADKRHGYKGSILTFDLDKFVGMCKNYGLDENEYVIDIQTKLDPNISDCNPSIEPSEPSCRHVCDNNNQEFPPKCYHCNVNGFSTKDQYEEHGVRIHKNLPLYPGPADLESLGLTRQNMLWEQELPREQYFEFELESKK